jgi:lactoylglutathione lyase
MYSIYRAATIVTFKSVGQSRAMITTGILHHPNCRMTITRVGAALPNHMFQTAYMSTTKNVGSNSIRQNSNSTISKRPFTILGVQQIAIGHDDRAALNRLWYTIFGLQPSVQSIKMQNENVCEDIVRVGGTNEATSIEIDLMTPLDINKSPKVHIPPLNHIGLWVDDLPTAVEWMTHQGVRFTPGGIRKGAAGYDVTFIHPKGNDTFPIGGNGILIELVQAPEHIKDMLLQQQPK